VYKQILIATDGSQLATKALEHGLALAKRDNARVTIVTVTEPWPALEMAQQAREGRADPVGQFEAIAADAANRILDDAAQRATAAGVAHDRVHVRDQRPAEGIVATAKDKGCDLIVMASHGRRGISRMMLGSQAYEVLAHSSVPVLIVR
jgi:nucleotide-binding universal stress UspA family protein